MKTVPAAEALLVALETPAPNGAIGVPVLLWGKPGTGKSAFVQSLADAQFPVYVLIASIHDPTDFSGLPVYEAAGSVVRFAPPQWVERFEQTGQGILFLDELTTAPPSVQSALLRVVLERHVGDRALPAGVRVLAAANPPEIAATGWDLSAPLANRFVHLEWDMPLSAYTDALEQGFGIPERKHIDRVAHAQSLTFWRLLLSAFLRRMPNLLYTEPAENEYAFATPRTWDFAVHLMASCDLLGLAPGPGRKGSAVFLHLMTGCVGQGAARALIEHLSQLRLSDPLRLLSGEEEADIGALREDEVYVLFASVGAALSQLYQQHEQSSRRDGFKLSRAVEAYLRLCEQTAQAGKLDAAYISIRRVVLEGLFQSALVAAHQHGQAQELSARMKQIFEHTDLADYVGALGLHVLRETG